MINARETVLAILFLFYVRLTVATQNVKVQGSNFVNNVTGNRLQIIGVAYQPGGSSGFEPDSGVDPLSNGTLCLRDAALMQQLGVNTIRIYNLDPDINHDLCVSIFNAVGIYLLIDVNSPLPNQSLNPDDLGSAYSSTYLKHIFGIVEGFKNYPNLLGFFSGNEVMDTVEKGQNVPPYLRAVTRDLKNYIKNHAPRMFPVGYSAADVPDILTDSWSYLSCNINGQSGDPSRSDFFTINSYSWCGPTSKTANFYASSYDKILDNFGNTSIPIFFSEYGCNKVEPRVFDEVPVIYGNMTTVMSGGIVYEWYYEEDNKYGLAQFYDNGTAQLLVDYDNLQKQYNKLDLKFLQSMNSSAATVQSPKCSKDLLSSNGTFNNSFTLPAVPSGGQTLIDKGIPNPPVGKIVSIPSNNVELPVYASNGKLINNLAIKPLANDQSNTPNGENTSGTSSGAPPSSSKKSGAGKTEIGIGVFFGLVLIALIFVW